MRIVTLISIAALAVSMPALAREGNNGGGEGGCGVGQQTNGCGGAEGGQGGHGGVGLGVGVGIAGAVASTGPISNTNLNGAHASTGPIRNDNNNVNLNGANATSRNDNVNVSGSNASNRNDIDNKNTISTLGINSSTNTVKNAVTNTVGNTLGNVTSEGSNASANNANNSSVVVEGDNYRRQVATAYSAPLVASVDTCMGSTTMGAQGAVFGVSIGSTWTDKNCVRLKNSRELVALGNREAAVQLLCTDKEVKAAMLRAGTPCK